MPHPAAALPAPRTGSGLARFCVPTIADAVFALILLRVLQLGATGLFNDPGTGWHLRTGLEVIATGQVPTVDTFTCTRAGQPWVATQWLADVVMSLAYALGGYSLMAVGTAGLIAGLFRWIYRKQVAAGSWPFVAAVVTVLAACAASGHFLARPLVATSIGIPLSFWWATEYARGRVGRWRLWALVPLAAVWTNLHPGVVGGVATVGLCGMGTVAQGCWKRVGTVRWQRGIELILVALGMAVATLVNPYGPAWHAWVARLMNMTALSAYVIEWKPPAWTDAATIAGAALLGAGALAAVIRRKGVNLPEALLLCFWAYNGFNSGRHLPLMTMIVAVQLGRLLADVRTDSALLRRITRRLPVFSPDIRAAERRLSGGLASVVLVGGLAALLVSGVTVPALGLGTAGPSPDRYSPGAVAYLRSHPPCGPFLNDLNYGGTIIHNLPGLRVFADDRFELHGAAFVAEYAQAVLEPGIHAADFLDRNDIQTVLIAAPLPLCEWLRSNGQWTEEYTDRAAAVFTRDTPCRDNDF